VRLTLPDARPISVGRSCNGTSGLSAQRTPSFAGFACNADDGPESAPGAQPAQNAGLPQPNSVGLHWDPQCKGQCKLVGMRIRFSG
jgi:hypothetical protein